MSSMGMNKSGAQSVAPGAWVKLEGFVVRSGFPATNIVNSALVMNESGMGDIAFQGYNQLTTHNIQFRVVLNGTTVLGSPVSARTPGAIPGVAVSAGDTLELQALNNDFFARQVPGDANTYLTFTQTTQDHPAGAGPNIGWYTSSTVNLERAVQPGATTVGWNVQAGIGKEAEIATSRSIGWSTQADLYVGQKYEVDANPTIGWAVSADIEVLRKAQPPEVLWEDTAVSIHTADGRLLGTLLCDAMDGLVWGRERREVSGCEVVALTQADPELIEDIRPWVHWVTVWHGQAPVWSGPIQSATIGRARTRIVAKDPATFMWRTRVPITYRWA
ncbi:hypothetical protein L612_010000000010, partial [Rhodococcus rhodochrous J38]